MKILAGDIGGTKTVLGLFETNAQQQLINQTQQYFANKNYQNLHDILAEFLVTQPDIDAACFGIAGPIVNQRCEMTLLPWMIDGSELKAFLGTGKVKLLNDLEAMSMGMLQLEPDQLVELNPGAIDQPGNKAVLAAGTGLGESIMYWDGERHHAIATEGGHCDIASQNEQQDQLLLYLRQQFPEHVSYERILCGDGFSLLYDFLVGNHAITANPEIPNQEQANTASIDRNALISDLGVNHQDAGCEKVLDLFVSLYGAEAGNLALKCLAVGGVFIGGGIAPKILPALQNGHFMSAFTAKGRFQDLLKQIPVKVSIYPDTPLLGAANYFLDHSS